MSSRHKRSKTYGYATEIAALNALRSVFPLLRRTGSVAYKKDAADLVQESEKTDAAYRFVVTRDKRRELLITMSVDDFNYLVGKDILTKVYVQVKGRERTWIGSLYQALKEATR